MEKTIKQILESIDKTDKLTDKEKYRIRYYLTDEDFANERFAMINLSETILKLL